MERERRVRVSKLLSLALRNDPKALALELGERGARRITLTNGAPPKGDPTMFPSPRETPFLFSSSLFARSLTLGVLGALLLSSGCGKEEALSPVLSSSANGIVALVTDYGASSIDVGVLEGYVLTGNPAANVVVGSAGEANIPSTAFTLRTLSLSFPSGTVFVCSVAPGVLGKGGSKPIVVDYDHRYFAGPDNGVFTYLLDDQTKVAGVYALHDYGDPYQPLLEMINDEVYGIAGGLLSAKTLPSTIGDPTTETTSFPVVRASVEGGVLTTQVLYVDQWGNVVTNASDAEWSALAASEGDTLQVNAPMGMFTVKVGTDFGSVPEGEKVIFLASDYFVEHLVELAINFGSLAMDAKIEVGDTLMVKK